MKVSRERVEALLKHGPPFGRYRNEEIADVLADLKHAHELLDATMAFRQDDELAAEIGAFQQSPSTVPDDAQSRPSK